GINGNFNSQPFDLSLNNSTFAMGTMGTASAAKVSIANSSAMSFADNGTLNATGDLTMIGASTLAFQKNGAATVNAINITGGSISFSDTGSLHAKGNLVDAGAPISFTTAGNFQIDGTIVNVSGGGSIGFGTLSVPSAYPYVTGDTGSVFAAPNAAATFDNSQ